MRRYERSRPGELVHIDVKKLGRIPDGGGHKALARRHARDYERLIQHSETLITWAAITLMARRLALKGATPSWPKKPPPANG